MDEEVTFFRCGNSSIEQQIKDSYFATLLKQAYGHKILIDGKCVGYYMLMFKHIELDDINQIMCDEYQSDIANYYTSIHIKYLAIDERYQNNKIGTTVLRAILSQILKLSMKYPIRIITIDALDKYYEWYKAIGFRDMPSREYDGVTHPMFMDCMTEDDVYKLKNYTML